MSAVAEAVSSGLVPYRLREFHAFESAGTRFVYLVPSGAILALNPIGREIVDQLADAPHSREELVDVLVRQGRSRGEAANALLELEQSDVVLLWRPHRGKA